MYFEIPLGIRKQDSVDTACLHNKDETPEASVQTLLAQAFGISHCLSHWHLGLLVALKHTCPSHPPHPTQSFILKILPQLLPSELNIPP